MLNKDSSGSVVKEGQEGDGGKEIISHIRHVLCLVVEYSHRVPFIVLCSNLKGRGL